MAVTGGYTPISDKPTSSGDLETWNDSSELSPHLLREARLWMVMDVQYISIPCAIHVVLVSLSNGLMVDLQINLTFLCIYIYIIYYTVQTPRIKNN